MNNDHSILANTILKSPLIKIPGIGTKANQQFSKMNIKNFWDLLWHLPIHYEDRTQLTNLKEIQNILKEDNKEKYQLDTSIIQINHIKGSHSSHKSNGRLQLLVQDLISDEKLEVILFKPQQHQIRLYQKGQKLRIYGRLQASLSAHIRFSMIHPEIEILKDPPQELPTELTPIYRISKSIRQKNIRKWIQHIILTLEKTPFTIDLLPKEFIQTLNPKACDLLAAFKIIHQGQHKNQGDHPAFQRLIIEEISAHLALWYLQNKTRAAKPLEHDIERPRLSFQLTQSQEKCLQEIVGDLKQKQQMTRLLQGDVGSGKTIIAHLSALHAVNNNAQVAILCPTEILAQQHFESLLQILPNQIQVDLITGQYKNKQWLEKIKNGNTQIIIGTHAIFQDSIEYKCLNYIIIDEQHKFGVEQRLKLMNKGLTHQHYPHQLLLTATPIPRTLTMTLLSSLKISTLTELPPNRKKVITRAISTNKYPQLIERAREYIAKGQQIYWVCQNIGDLQTESSAIYVYEFLKNTFGQKIVKILHGELTKEEIQENLSLFSNGCASILVATSIIEVGVNIPNANVMIIENGHNWGLSQLHQLRGRIGRGENQGYMIMLYPDNINPLAYQRLDTLRKTQDGFEIAEIDLELRGPGDIFSREQSGQNHFIIYNPIHDKALFNKIQKNFNLFINNKEILVPFIKRWFKHYIEEKI